MNENWAIFIGAALFLIAIAFSWKWNQYVASGIAIISLLIIALVFYLKNVLKKSLISDTLPKTRYSYS